MAKKKQRKTYERARDAVTGRFVSLEDAAKRPANTVVERIKRPGA